MSEELSSADHLWLTGTEKGGHLDPFLRWLELQEQAARETALLERLVEMMHGKTTRVRGLLCIDANRESDWRGSAPEDLQDVCIPLDEILAQNAPGISTKHNAAA